MRKGLDSAFLSCLLATMIRTSWSDMRCSSELPADPLTQVCAGAVDYAFFVPDGYTEEDLAIMAVELASDPSLFILPASCQRDLKLSICANVYKRCAPGSDLQDPTSWSPVTDEAGTIVSVLPFERPCKSICINTTYQGATCAGLLEAFGVAPDCDAIDPSTGFPQYAKDDDVLESCNALSSTAPSVAVAGTREDYSGSTCAGLVPGGEIYIPSSQTLDPSFAPMLPPGMVQAILEAAAVENLSILPAYVEERCRVAATKLTCSMAMMPPEHQPQLAPYLPEVYVPQFPARSLCEDFNSLCAGFIALASSTGQNLEQNCTSLTVDGLWQFPEDLQTIVTVPVPGLAEGVALTSPPNTMADISVPVSPPLCPLGFVVPDDPEDELSVEISGTACHIQCPLAVFTDQQYDTMNTFMFWTNIMGIVFGGYNALTYSIFRSRRKQGIVRGFAICSWLVAVLFFTQMMMAPSFGERFCRNNSAPKTQEDGGMCVFMSIAVNQLSFMCVCYWFCLAFDIWIKAVKQKRNVAHYMRYYHIFSFAFPIVVSVGPRFFLGNIGYALGSSLCLSTDAEEPWLAWTLFYGPIMLLVVSGMLLMVSLFRAIHRSVKNDKRGTAAKRFKMFRQPAAFVFLFAIPWIIIFSVVILIDSNTTELYDSFAQWTACMFSTFTPGSSSESICGARPPNSTPMPQILALNCSIYGQCLFLFAIFGLSRDNMKLWAHALGLSRLNPNGKQSSRTAASAKVLAT
jgi:hypothetical protein